MILNTFNIHATKAIIAIVLAISYSSTLFAAKEVTTAYVVKRGDTYASIAKKFGLTEEELKNDLVESCYDDRQWRGFDRFKLRIADVLYIKHMDYSEEKKHDRMKKSAAALKTESVTREPQRQLTEKHLLECERVFGQKILDEDFRAALCRFNSENIWSLREKTLDATGRREIYEFFNKADGKPDYALLFNGERKSLYRIDEAQGNKKIVTQLNVDSPRKVVDISDFKKAFKEAHSALVLTSDHLWKSDKLYMMCNQRTCQTVKIEEKPAVVGSLYFDANIYETLKAVCPNAVNSFRVNLKFISDEADPVDLGYYYLCTKVSRKELIKPMKKGLQEVVDRNWRLDRPSSRPASPPSVTDSEVRYLIDCPGHLKISSQQF